MTERVLDHFQLDGDELHIFDEEGPIFLRMWVTPRNDTPEDNQKQQTYDITSGK